jgi:hypothetical protein
MIFRGQAESNPVTRYAANLTKDALSKQTVSGQNPYI